MSEISEEQPNAANGRVKSWLATKWHQLAALMGYDLDWLVHVDEPPNINADLESNKKLASFNVENSKNSIQVAHNEVVSLEHWVLTSLLAVNGAAAVATWQAQDHGIYHLIACVAFAVGVIFSLLSAKLSANFNQRLMMYSARSLGYWLGIEQHGMRIWKYERNDTYIAHTIRLRRPPEALVWLSMLAFVIGLAVDGYGAVNSDNAGSKVTSTVEHHN